MTVAFQTRTAAGVPLLLARADGSTDPPLVFWFHGFGADKEVHRPELARLAQSGFLAVGVDAAGHGERLLPEEIARIHAASREEALPRMAELAARTAADMPGVIDALVRDGAAAPGRIGAVGVSMGAYALLRSLVLEPRIGTAVSILGSPEWPHPASPHHHLEALARPALLSINAERDDNVPPDAARRLHRQLQERHPHARHRYLELPEARHLMTAEQWSLTMEQTLAWLTHHLR